MLIKWIVSGFNVHSLNFGTGWQLCKSEILNKNPMRMFDIRNIR
jgi:hypothetical protein